MMLGEKQSHSLCVGGGVDATETPNTNRMHVMSAKYSIIKGGIHRWGTTFGTEDLRNFFHKSRRFS